MTVEERTKNVIDKTALSGWEYDTLFKEITQALRDQIEECVKVGEKHLRIRREMLKTSAVQNDTYAFRGHTDAIFTTEVIIEQIRALAGQKAKEKA